MATRSMVILILVLLLAISVIMIINRMGGWL